MLASAHRFTSLLVSRRFLSGGIAAILIASTVLVAAATEYISGKHWAEPKVIESGVGGSPPSDAIVLFDGKDLSQWEPSKWIVKDGYAVSKGADIHTKQSFGNCQLHIEFTTPEQVHGHSQERGNSGVFLMSTYELQVLDSYDNKTYFDGQCASIYKQRPPLVNACRKPGEWQTYDIIFAAPVFTGGKLTSPAFITVLQNGVLVQNHFQLEGDTPYNRAPQYNPHPAKMPLRLQYHGNPVRFRNIWIREL